jgi:hypothetical protein
MSSKTKSISAIVTDLQQENESLQSLKKLFNQACKSEFGFDVKTIHQLLEKQRILEQRATEKQGPQTTISPSEM